MKRLILQKLNSYLFVVCFSVILSCDDPNDDCSFYDHPVANYTQIDINRKVYANDDNDWRTNPKYGNDITIYPAYPNSNGGNTIITVPIIIWRNENGALSNIGIIGQTDKDQWVNIQSGLTGDNTTPDPGAYDLKIDLTKLASDGKLSSIQGLKRIYVIDDYLDTDLCRSIISYGDIKITP